MSRSRACRKARVVVGAGGEYVPLFWVLLTSFEPPEISQALPPVWNFTPTWQNYRDVMTGNTYLPRRSAC